ncbi:hypothetical protein SAMN05421807_112132 [Virgibacillus chiguensis]|uniref:Uncharacterized protein n=2 Tax=Bacillaceae TaxID=186817 RepID=A0A1M5VI38_9BACI|nr:hypothetical protein SAMN05421807_112132 [Virgibacillus chiguensis]
MKMQMHNISNVRLPEWIWETAQNEADLKRLVIKYMWRYPGYRVLKVKGRFAVCEIER